MCGQRQALLKVRAAASAPAGPAPPPLSALPSALPLPAGVRPGVGPGLQAPRPEVKLAAGRGGGGDRSDCSVRDGGGRPGHGSHGRQPDSEHRRGLGWVPALSSPPCNERLVHFVAWRASFNKGLLLIILVGR